ncbi:hypothetical protein OAP18_00125 [Gammaproteobacteria bacterium]|nr:hypothetical protein [Gammaproteobacteria bacterium]
MRGLAEYAMLGRRQAIIVVLLSGFLPMFYFVSAATVGLVNLRKDLREGLIILLWSLLPAVMFTIRGDATPLILMFGIAGLSQLLKHRSSWQKVILLGTGLGLLIQLSLIWQTSYLQQVELFVAELIAAQVEQGVQTLYSAEQLIELVLGFYGAYHVTAIILCLMLARWWQASLYNPGGFQQEFYQLRFDPRIMLVILVLILAGLMAIEPLDSWLVIFCIPPMMGGIALMHYVVAKRKMGATWLILCYVTLFMLPPIVIVLGLLDSVFDIRKRIIT